MYTLYGQLKNGRYAAFISLGDTELQDPVFDTSIDEVLKAAGVNRPINTKDVNRFLNFVSLALKKHIDEVKKDLCRNFVQQMLATCEEEGIDYDVPEVVNHFLNKWI